VVGKFGRQPLLDRGRRRKNQDCKEEGMNSKDRNCYVVGVFGGKERVFSWEGGRNKSEPEMKPTRRLVAELWEKSEGVPSSN